MFSVVIPVYNHRQYLPRAVLSALRSSLVSEILLMDDNSQDGSVQAIEWLSRAFPHRVRQLAGLGDQNQGASALLNQLCQEAKSPWLSVLNSDDEFAPGRFELLRAVIKQSKTDFVCGALLILNEHGTMIGRKRGISDPEYELPSSLKNCTLDSTQDIRRVLCSQNFIATTSNMVFRKTLFDQIGGFRNFRYVHDWDFALRATMAGRCEFTPNFLTFYRLHSANTIREGSAHVDGEVVRLMYRFLEEFPQVEQDPFCRDALKANRHLGRYVALKSVNTNDSRVPGRKACIGLPRRCMVQQAPDSFPDGMIGLGEEQMEVPWTFVDYLYQPKGSARVSRRAFANVLLCLRHFDYDFIIISETLEELPIVSVGSVLDNTIFNQKAAGFFLDSTPPPQSLRGRIIRIVPSKDKRAQKINLLTFWDSALVQIDQANISINHKTENDSIIPRLFPRTPPLNTRKVPEGKPIVLVLPVFLAVGGVERNMVEILRVLRNRYDFVVITTERLAKHQGSLHFQLDDINVTTFDLAEIAEQAHHLKLFQDVAQVISPDLVWICNGSPWLADHSEELRRIFSRIPIVDQQAYDTEHGWINRYADRGIQSFDRFIAINSKIRRKFLADFRIPKDRVNLIYHAIDAHKLAGKEEDRRTLRLQHKIPLDEYCFAFIGRLTAQKRPLRYLLLAKKAQALGLRDHFLLVGDGELRSDCDSYIAENRLTNVICLRFYKNVCTVVPMIDGLIITSAYEGLPIVLLETLALGKPALSSDVGDCRIIFDQYQNGKIVFDSENADSLMSGFLEWRRELSELTQRAGACRTDLAERFSAESGAEQYDKVWTSCLHEYGIGINSSDPLLEPREAGAIKNLYAKEKDEESVIHSGLQ